MSVNRIFCEMQALQSHRFLTLPARGTLMISNFLFAISFFPQKAYKGCVCTECLVQA